MNCNVLLQILIFRTTAFKSKFINLFNLSNTQNLSHSVEYINILYCTAKCSIYNIQGISPPCGIAVGFPTNIPTCILGTYIRILILFYISQTIILPPNLHFRTFYDLHVLTMFK